MSGAGKVKGVLPTCARWYSSVVLTLFNTFLLFVLLNVALYYYYQRQDRRAAEAAEAAAAPPATNSNPTYDMYGTDKVRQAYPRLTSQEVDQLLAETYTVGIKYEPFTEFAHVQYTPNTKWVTVDNEGGFRHSKNQGPWPPDPEKLNIFFFGGSTMFGYGESNDQTIASHLQDYLMDKTQKEPKVYNFGRMSYFSHQERALFERLMIHGHVPHVAIFIDGMNDLNNPTDTTPHSEAIAKGLALHFGGPPKPEIVYQSLLDRLPVTRLINSFKKKIAAAMPPGEVERSDSVEWNVHYQDDQVVGRMLGVYSVNKRMTEITAREFQVLPLFVWQPAPSYKYDNTYHLFGAEGANFTAPHMRYGYETMRARVRPAGVKGTAEGYTQGFVWLGDIQAERKEPLYVDGLHYSGKFNQEIAAWIGGYLLGYSAFQPFKK